MRQDDAYLLDMLVAAHQAMPFVADLTYSQFERSEWPQNAIFRVLEVVGEAVSRIGEATKRGTPIFSGEIPWRKIVGLHNRIVRGYFESDVEIVWWIVNDDLSITDIAVRISRTAR